MNCDEVRCHWNLYHDSEGDAELHWQVRQHLDNCPACAEWFAKQSRFEDLIAAKLREPVSNDKLWTPILVGAGVTKPAATRRWILFTSLAACAAIVLVTISLVGLFNDRSSLSRLTAEWHERLAKGELQPPFTSSSDLSIEEYLKREVSFPVRCPPRKDSGFAVRGAGVCRLREQPTAYVTGHVGQTPVSIFILSRDSLAAFPHQQAALQRETVHRCREGRQQMALSIIDRNLVLVIGQVPEDRLLKVLRAFGTYPHHST